MSEKKLFLLDSYALIYRSYYAFFTNPMYNSKRFNTSTLYGFLLSVDELLRVQKPTHIAAVFDSSHPTFRHEMYPDYKANRDETPEEIKLSVPIIKELLKHLNIQCLEMKGFEADDIVGTLAKNAAKDGYQVYMVTPDKDYGQLVEENIYIYKPKKSGNEAEVLGVKEINEKYGIQNPAQVIDILALWGDTSDNVPGIPGIGEKTASKLIGTYGSIDNLLQNLDKLSPKQRESIQNNLEILERAKKLVTIETQVPIDFNLDSLSIKNPNEADLINFYKEYEFKTFLRRMSASSEPAASPQVSSAPAKPAGSAVQGDLFSAPVVSDNQTITNYYNTIENTSHEYHLVDSMDQLNQLVALLSGKKEICFDTETTGLNPFSDQLIGISFSTGKGNGWYIQLNKNNIQDFIKVLKPVFENEEIDKIGHNLKFDILFLKNQGVNVKGNYIDTMLAHYLLEPDQSHKMDSVSLKYLNYEPIPIEKLIGEKGVGQKNMSQVPIELLKDYAAEDADVTYQLKDALLKIINERGLHDLFKMECDLMKVLVHVESNGVKVDGDFLKSYANQIRNEIIEVETAIYKDAGYQFNISSPKQLGELLFERLKISENAKLTKTKQYSTDEETLTELIDKHPIINKILDYRSLTKLLSTYIEALPKLINQHTGKIHTSFNQALAVTGRLSSLNPNLQNIPIKEQRGREIRRAFIPEKSDDVILSADYSQIELRIMAHMSNDAGMIEAFLNNADIHTSTAAKVYKVKPEEVTREQRSKAKTANFGIIYGISAFGLSQRLNIPRKEANELIEEYFNIFPGVKKYMQDSILFAKQNGYVDTLLKRRRYLPDINSKNANIRGMAERNAINSPIQGTAADIIKIAMINISNEMNKRNLKSQMILQVHDELVFNVVKDEIDEMKSLVKSQMESALKLKVPLTTEVSTGSNWLEAH